jgi:hypothetical protein
VPVHGAARDIQVKIASDREEWEQAFCLIAANYQARGYETPGAGSLRFTPYHALPDTVTFVAKYREHVVATLSYVPDNCLLGLPLERIYAPETAGLRQSGRHIGEATSLADSDLGLREFVPVFLALIRMAMQLHARQGGDTAVITVNPRHRGFYTKVIGFLPLGPCRAYSSVQDAPAEAYWLDWELMKANAPKTYQQVFGQDLPREALTAPPMPWRLVEDFASRSTQTGRDVLQKIAHFLRVRGSPRRW